MIVIVASAHDPRARELAAHWGPQCAVLLTAEDLSRPGWAFEVPDGPPGRFVADGEIRPQDGISGILTLRPRLYPEELAHVAAADRDYVAAEMTAILLAWLARQTCPVLNAPSARSLAGPDWPASRWRHEAARLGIPLGKADATAPLECIRVASLHFGDASLQNQVAALARTAGTELLGCRFTAEGQLVSATPWPLLAEQAVRDALKARLEGAGA